MFALAIFLGFFDVVWAKVLRFIWELGK
jgi:hypothetical protein